jgi:hypothetical protein
MKKGFLFLLFAITGTIFIAASRFVSQDAGARAGRGESQDA